MSCVTFPTCILAESIRSISSSILTSRAKKYDLPSFLREKLIQGADVRVELDQVEPPFAGYKRTQQALQRYMELSRQDDGEQLPVPAKPVEPGQRVRWGSALDAIVASPGRSAGQCRIRKRKCL